MSGGNVVLAEIAPQRRRVIEGGGEGMLGRQPIANRQRARCGCAARLGHHPAMADDGNRAGASRLNSARTASISL
jgi:hypothetical protein